MTETATARVLRLQAGSLWSLAISGDGEMLASGSDAELLLGPPDAARPVRLPGHRGHVFALAFAPGSAGLVSGGIDTTLRTWTRDGESLATRHGHDADGVGLGF